MQNFTIILRKEGVQTSSSNAERIEDARYDVRAMIRQGAADSAEIMLDGEVVERISAAEETNGTTVAELARELGMEPSGLRAFADDLLDGVADDQTAISADVEATLRLAHRAATAETCKHGQHVTLTCRECDTEAGIRY